MPNTTKTRPSLDDHRADQLRTILTVAAAADLARTTADQHPHRARRRLAVVGFAALLLAGAVVLTDQAPGGPRPQPAEASVVSIEEEQGWQVISLIDPAATGAQVVEQLEASGIEARTAPQGTEPHPGDPTWFDRHPDGGTLGVVTDAGIALQKGEMVPAGRIVGFDVSFPGIAGPSPSSGSGECVDAECDVDPEAERAWFDANGVRTDEAAGSVSVKAGTENSVIVYTAT